jgi:hypothetical protein
MMTTKHVMLAAGVISALQTLAHFLQAAKTQWDLRSYHLLGLDTPEFLAALHVVIRRNLIEGFWYWLITALVAFSIYRLRKSN